MTDMVWSHVDDVPAQRYTDDITLRPLWKGPADRKAYVVDLAPGAVWPNLDVHDPGPEEVFVVSGVFNDGVRDYPAGSFIHCPAGSSHVPQSTTGCRLFLFYPEG
ncbi:cupin domain-containing protein [Glycomyces sp. TRM65418]|uniref:cupin domain-containing protein n=1 Tax=Glycomyces sp. TRM65418 TaxID=2867006 RepID=UPI001CE5497C|nr:cupin domain-containing protein [Glycomyces sp. TRM65418]MCC3765061.1 cupin domain-containing protein [Glycomyces sp. TRM65418]QZD54691.1 cupin domain-containing protein [Glycomyces sp. TRM65418]